MFKFRSLVAASAILLSGLAFAPASVAAPPSTDIPVEKADQAAVKVLNGFLEALLIADEDESAKAVMKFVHKSLLNHDGKDLSKDLRRFSFHKAHQGAKFYEVPAKITRIRPTRISAIGFGATAEKGTVVDYFIAKKQGVAGMPAPVQIFFPEGGGEPKISYMGSI